MRTITAMLLLFLAVSVHAADRYVRQGAGGNGSGSDWNNAYTSLPSTLVRGDTYWIADGSYPGYTFDDPVSGSSAITIKKATVASHGTSTGWNNSYGDGQAVFSGGFILITSNYVIDGSVRNEDNWSDGNAYGFRLSSVHSNRLSYGVCADNITLQYLNIDEGGYGRPLYLGGFGGGSLACENWIIRRNYVHNAGDTQLVGSLNTLIEYNWFGPTWGKEIIRGQVSTRNTTIRYNIFYNGCRDDNEPGVGCTAEVAFFGNQGDTPDFEGVYVYGNVVWKTIGQHKTDATFWFQANDCKIYNNTIYDNARSGQGRLSCSSGSGSVIRNNITYFPAGLGSGCSAAVCDNNSHYTSGPPFVSVAGGDFRLSAPLAGASLAAPYNGDMRGTARGSDGTWDRGAYEYGGAAPPSIAKPGNLRIVN